MMEVVSIQVGKPETKHYEGKIVETALYKKPVDQDLFLAFNNFEGDAQADLKHHGGRDKAVCVYSAEHYPHWQRFFGWELGYGGFGENLTVKGLVETDVHIGDTFQLGEAVVQVSQPRQPCHKLAKRYDRVDFAKVVEDSGYTGYYLRVLKEGKVPPRVKIEKLQEHPLRISVDFANQIMHHDKENVEAIKRVLEVEELSASWRKTFTKRLEGQFRDEAERRLGE